MGTISELRTPAEA